MELLMILIVIGILVSVVTGNPGYILMGISGILLVLSGALTVIFIIACVLLLISKPRKGEFVRIDVPAEGGKYKVAFYRVDGEEIPCLFPEEGIFRKKLYKEGKTYHVLLNKKLGRVFDRYAIITCILGLFCGLGLGIAILSF